LRRDPYERFYMEGEMYLRWFGSRMFLMGPVQGLVAKQLASMEEFPPARGSSLSLGKLLDDITYQAGSASQ
jgi:arylsulfatase